MACTSSTRPHRVGLVLGARHPTTRRPRDVPLDPDGDSQCTRRRPRLEGGAQRRTVEADDGDVPGAATAHDQPHSASPARSATCAGAPPPMTHRGNARGPGRPGAASRRVIAATARRRGAPRRAVGEAQRRRSEAVPTGVRRPPQPHLPRRHPVGQPLLGLGEQRRPRPAATHVATTVGAHQQVDRVTGRLGCRIDAVERVVVGREDRTRQVLHLGRGDPPGSTTVRVRTGGPVSVEREDERGSVGRAIATGLLPNQA